MNPDLKEEWLLNTKRIRGVQMSSGRKDTFQAEHMPNVKIPFRCYYSKSISCNRPLTESLVAEVRLEESTG